MLRGRRDEAGEGGKEGFEAGTGEAEGLAGEEGCERTSQCGSTCGRGSRGKSTINWCREVDRGELCGDCAVEAQLLKATPSSICKSAPGTLAALRVETLAKCNAAFSSRSACCLTPDRPLCTRGASVHLCGVLPLCSTQQAKLRTGRRRVYVR